ncbi:MAG: DUF3667 domain-containing protein [Flavobacteriales bacterium]
MARKHRHKSYACPNCGAELQPEFEFCPRCGQENHDLRVPFKTFLYEFVEGITHFDAKLWSTLKVIFTEPGRITKDYVEGRRARYVHPARFYIFTSFVFFALLTWTLDRAVEQSDDDLGLSETNDNLRLAYFSRVLPDSVWSEFQQKSSSGTFDRYRGPFHRLKIPIDKPYYRASATQLSNPSPSVLDSLVGLVDLEDTDTLPGTRARLRSALAQLPDADSLDVCYTVQLNGLSTSFCDRREEALFRTGDLSEADVDSLLGAGADSVGWLKRRLIRSLGRLNTTTPEGKQRLGHVIIRSVSAIMFILMPFTAVLLLWIFFRKRFYWEHLIFSVHVHTICFLFFMILLLLGLLIPWEWPAWINGVIFLVLLVYLLFSLKHVYGKPWPSTLLRSVLMAVPYFLVTIVLMLFGLLWGFINL